jgi:2-polyprenyl-3-methyl-5-hydroxy-6-metoxy-1,4-benzoquinol methylase
VPAAVKPAGYFAQDRAELVALLPRPLGRVLDVGCGEGATGRSLRAAGASWISGIELDVDAAAAAAEAYDEVRTGRVEDELGGLSGPFDTIVLYDVLEHLPEPWVVLRRLHEVAVPAARVHVSVPNARHWTLLRDVALRGSFGYGDAGHRDRTHLRWFTKRDLVELLEETGWNVESTAHGELRPISRLAERLTRGLSAEFLVYQLSALARADGSAPAGPRESAG